MADSVLAAVPGKEVKKGESWSRESKLSMGPIGTYVTIVKYTPEGTEGRLDRIKADGTMRYEAPPKGPAGVALPFKVKQSDLKGSVSGTVLFNRAKGRVERSDMVTKVEGKLTVEIGGTETAVDLTQTVKTTVQTTDTNPAQSKRPVP
jgi:hypothetical protein